MARINNLTNFLTDVATSIKAKTGDSSLIPASQFDTKIAGITTGKLSNEEYTKANNNLDEILYQSENVLPDTYQQVEYLEASGTQYIDTNFTSNTDTKAYAEFYVSTTPCGLYSSDSGASLPTNFSSYISGSGKWRFGSGVATVPISSNSFYTSIQDKTGITINGTIFYDYDTTINDFTSTKTITLLRTNTVGFKGKIYKFKLYDGNDIVRNFIPCYRKSDNEAGMYDTVNNVFYTNEGTGDFVVGEDVDVLNTKIESILTEKNAKILSANIKDGINILGIEGEYTGNLTNIEYQEANDDLDDILEGSTPTTIYPPDWSELGYEDTPQSIIDDFDYSKEIYDNWDSSVTDISYRFNADTTLRYIPIIDTSNATNMRNTFNGCAKITFFPQLNTGNATNMRNMLANCNSLINVSTFDTSSVTNMRSMFQNCTELVSVPLLNTANVTDISFIFSNCLKLSNESLNNILQMCINATSYTGTKTLQQLGLTSEQSTTCQSLSNYQDFLTAGWTTGY